MTALLFDTLNTRDDWGPPAPDQVLCEHNLTNCPVCATQGATR